MARTKVHGEYLDPSVISAQTEVTAVGSDHMLIFDATDNALKKALLSDLIETVGSTPSFTSATISGDLTVDTSTLKVDSSNNRVGIGTSSPSAQFHIVNADDAVARIESSGSEATDDARLEIKTTNGTFTIQNDRSLGTTGALTFAGNTSDNIVIDHATGSVGIGTTADIATSSSSSSTGFWFSSSDYLAVARNQQRAAIFNRIGDDGEVVAIRKDGSTVGSIVVNSSTIQMGTNNTHLAFSDADDAFFVKNAAGANRDGSHDLGKSNARFKDLYLSGGAYLGGTGSANHLDDYEEGNFTATLKGGSTGTLTQTSAKYTKIGRTVNIQVSFLNVNTTGYSGHLRVVGLPFTQSTSNLRAPFTPASYTMANFSGEYIIGLVESGTDVNFYSVRSNNTWTTVDHNAGTGRYLEFEFTYITDS